MANIFGMREPETPGEKKAYEMGREAADATFTAVSDYLDQRLPEVATRLVDAFRQRLGAVLHRPEHPPVLLAKIEFDIFQQQLDTFQDQLNSEVNQNLNDWIGIAEQMGTRALIDQFVQNRTFMAKIAIWEASIHVVASALASVRDHPVDGPT